MMIKLLIILFLHVHPVASEFWGYLTLRVFFYLLESSGLVDMLSGVGPFGGIKHEFCAAIFPASLQ